jgi:hypothetical protein
MSQQTYFFRCGNCSVPIPLLNTTLSESSAPRRVLPKSGSEVVIVCPYCKRGAHYKTDEIRMTESANIRDSNPAANLVVWSTTTRCGTTGCGDFYRVLSLLESGSTKYDADTAVHAAASSVCCSFGHTLEAGGTLGPTELWVQD